jgi:hypothetical protein
LSVAAKVDLTLLEKRKGKLLVFEIAELTSQRLKQAGIIDEVIDDFMPKCFLVPFYGKKEIPVTLGNIFKQSKTKEKPSLKIYCPDIQNTPSLTIALTDPDAPSRENPKWSEMCHWIGIVPILDQKQSSDGNGFETELHIKELVECEDSN